LCSYIDALSRSLARWNREVQDTSWGRGGILKRGGGGLRVIASCFEVTIHFEWLVKDARPKRKKCLFGGQEGFPVGLGLEVWEGIHWSASNAGELPRNSCNLGLFP
jgi:hypothetical protein